MEPTTAIKPTPVNSSSGFSPCDSCERILPDNKLWLHHASWLCAECHPNVDAEELVLEEARERDHE